MSLTKSTGNALRWNYIGIAAKMVLTFGINILLTRLLGPKPFGEMQVAMIVFGFGVLLSNVGLTTALIQKPDMDEMDIRFCFTCQLAIALLMSAALFLSSGFWGRFFHDVTLVPILHVFSSLFLLQAFGTTATALLSKRQDTRTIQRNTILSYLIAYVGICVPMALHHCGVWSLVTALLSQAAINSVLTYAQVRHSLRLRFHPDHVPLLNFGTKVLGANVCSWGIFNLDNTIVGRVAGPIALGYYSRAFTVATSADGISWGLLQVLLPAFSRVQDNTEKLRGVYAAVLGIVMLTFLPLFSTVAATAEIVVLGLYGPKWMAVVPMLRPIALAVCVNAALAIAGPLLLARGLPRKEFQAQLTAVVFGGAAYALSIHWSLTALAWTVLGVYLFRFTLLTRSVNQTIGTRWKDILEVCLPAMFTSAFSALVGRVCLWQIPDTLPAAVRLAIVITTVFVCDVVFLFATRRWMLRPILKRAPQLLLIIPSSYHRWIVPATEGLA